MRALIEVRFAHIVPYLRSIGGHAGKIEKIDARVFAVSWKLEDGDRLQLTANLSAVPAPVPAIPSGTPFYIHPSTFDPAQGTLPPWSVIAARVNEG